MATFLLFLNVPPTSVARTTVNQTSQWFGEPSFSGMESTMGSPWKGTYHKSKAMPMMGQIHCPIIIT